MTHVTQISAEDLSVRAADLIRALCSRHPIRPFLNKLKKFLDPIKEGFGKCFIDRVNEDIESGYYKPSFLDYKYKTNIPDRLMKHKANPNDLYNYLSKEDQIKFMEATGFNNNNTKRQKTHDTEDDTHDSQSSSGHNATHTNATSHNARHSRIENESTGDNEMIFTQSSYQEEESLVSEEEERMSRTTDMMARIAAAKKMNMSGM